VHLCAGAAPADARLLAALRVMLLQERALAKGRSLQELGDWDMPLGRAHEVCLGARLLRPALTRPPARLPAAGCWPWRQRSPPLVGTRSQAALPYPPPPPRAQALVLKALVGLCTVLYKGLPTSIQQDMAALAAQQQQQPGGSRMALALAFRLASKRTLEGATRCALQRLQALQGQSKVVAAGGA
jgi:hypothetical protein